MGSRGWVWLPELFAQLKHFGVNRKVTSGAHAPRTPYLERAQHAVPVPAIPSDGLVPPAIAEGLCRRLGLDFNDVRAVELSQEELSGLGEDP